MVTAQLPPFVHVDPGVSETLVVSSTASPCPSLGRQEACALAAVSLRCVPSTPHLSSAPASSGATPISPRSHGFFCWRRAFRAQDPGLAVCTAASVTAIVL